MKDRINKLKAKKYATTIIIGLLLVFVLGLFTLLGPSIKNIKINKVLSKTTALNASVNDAISEGVSSNNYDEIKYQIKVNKENSDTAIITGTLTNKENKYARFKQIKDSIVSEDGKTITLTTTRNKVTITVIITNAPYGTTINPNFSINSVDESKSKINVDPVTITGKSVEGKIYDESGTFYNGLELSLNKNGEEVKRTYTRDDGEYVFSLGDVDTYSINLEEDKYKIVRYTEETTDENRRVLNIVIKEVEPFKLSIKKSINKLDLLVNGNRLTYNYNDETKVVQSLKQAKTIEGSVYYNINIKNTGEIKGTLTVLKDIIPDGLSFDKSKNPGWTKDGKYIYYTVIEGKEIEPFGKLNASLVLDIVKTDEAKTYINTAIASGDDYKYVGYYLNNKLYKEEYVIASEKIQNIIPNIENFDGWYTDKKYTNKYNFKNQVLKDTILFGKISNKKYNVTFIDINPNNNMETTLDAKEVEEGNPVDIVDAPTYNGYTFKCFTLNNECYDFEDINDDVTLYTKYTVNQYNIAYDLDGGTLSEENPDVYTVKYGITLNNPTKEGYTFVGWTGTGLSENTLEVIIPVGSIGDRSYTANYEINKSNLTIEPNGGTYLDNSSSVTYNRNYGTIMEIVASSRRGYTFTGYTKTGGGIFTNNTYTFNNDDATLTANYNINTYLITYENITDEEKTLLSNPISYNVETETFTLNNPNTRLDNLGNNYQDFLGWDDGNGNVSNTVTITKGTVGNKSYTAVWKLNEDEYEITYNLNGGTLNNPNPNTYRRQTETFTLNNPTRTGYKFLGWSGTDIEDKSTSVTIPEGSAGNRSYTANYEAIPYTITYENITDDERTTLNNPTGYNIETETFTLSSPGTRYDSNGNKYQDFLGWDDGNGNVSNPVTITKGTTGNKTYTAVWKINEDEYGITYNLNGGTPNSPNPSTYTRQTETFTLNNPDKNGYNFTGWDGTGLIGENNIIVTIPEGSSGDRSYTAHYETIPYTITYKNITDAERTNLHNPTGYNVETETFTINNPASRLDNNGYSIEDFVGWDDGNGNVSTNITITKGTTGNKTYTAVWVDNEDEYNITYNLNSGTLSEENPNTYKRQTETFTLHNPRKSGYEFLGWSGTDIENKSTTVTIPQGSSGNRSYIAHYEVIPYTITYKNITDDERITLNNPTGYNVETETLLIHNPSRIGYEFLGWSGTGIADKSTSVTIPRGSTGNKEYTANFNKLEYSLTYTYNGGVPSGENPDKYSVDSSPITLHNPTKEGYTFQGWSGTDLTGNENMTVTIPTGSIGHRSFLANYTPIIYNITYDYDGGNLEDGVTNPSTYTIESETITFNEPVKEGYTFTNYTIGNEVITNIPTGSKGNKALKAHYLIKKYNINYYNENLLFSNEEVNWNTAATVPGTIPTKAHHIFLYWSEDGVNEYDFDTLIKADKNLYAVYEEVETPTITITPTLNEETNRYWVCDDSTREECGVTVTITSEHNDYGYYYKIGNGEATLYTGPFKVYENVEVTAWSKKSGINSESVEETISNVDSIAPTINQPATGAMSFNMSVSGTAQDAGSGVKKFTMYAKEKGALTFDDNFTYTSPDFDGIKDHAENYDHTFYGVQDNTEYIVKIVSEDYVGNVNEVEVEVKTKPYVARVVGKNGMLWYTVDPDTKEFVINEGKEFLMFDSIQAAVNYCANVQCTIQTNPTMPVVNESVTIGANQNITIDLDGRGIASTNAATFVNNGKLQIVDRNPRVTGENEHDGIGFVNNTVNKAIVNNNILIVGDGSSEPSEIFINPELDRPIIYGKVTGIEQNNEFHFYDGKIKSDSLAITDNGDDVITQYSYNVVITEEDDLNVATMERVDDPEARIKSTYYRRLNVKDGGDAFDASKSGTVTREERKMLSKIKQASDYGFVYDEVNDLIYNGNTSTSNTTALSYIKIDLTDYDEDQIIAFDTFIDASSANSYGFVSLSEEFGNQGTVIYKTTGNDVTGTKVYELKKNKVYYMYFGFTKGSGDVNIYEVFKVFNLQLLGSRESTSELTLYNSPDHYVFEKQADGSYVNTNANIGNSYAHSYIMYDLRSLDPDTTIDLVINYDIASHGWSTGYIYATDNADFQYLDNTNGRYLATSNYYSNQKIDIPLTPGIINYVHFGYYRNQWGDGGTFTIRDISLSMGKSENLISESTITNDSNYSYYFEKLDYDITRWKDTSGNNKHGTVSGAKLNVTQDGYNFYKNGYVVIDGGITETVLTSETVELEFSTTNIDNAVYYMGSNKEKISIGVWASQLIVTNASSTNKYVLPEEWRDGNKHKLVVICNEGVYDAYFDNVLMTKSHISDTFSNGLNESTYIGARSTGDYFGGAIYDVKVYDRALSEEEATGTHSDEGLLLHLDGSDSKLPTNGNITLVSNNRRVSNSIAHSYIMYDLTNVNRDKYLYVNATINSQSGSDFGYVQITDSPDYPTDTVGREISLSGNLANQTNIFRLPKNKISYIHFIYTKDDRHDFYTDEFVINEVKMFNSITDAYSVTSSDYSNNIDTMYFEKANINTSVDTIEMLKTITLDTPIVIPQEKEVVLDLNGFTLTSNDSNIDYLIKNNGRLTIKDSTYDDLKNINVNYATVQSELFEAAKTKYLADLAEYQEYAGLCDGCEPSYEYKVDNILDYAEDLGVEINSLEPIEIPYSGSYVKYPITDSYLYKIEAWGAKGGNNNAPFGNGGYTSGNIILNEGEELYIYVGGQGGSTRASVYEHIDGGYNGGGSTEGQNCCGRTYGSGGGATDIRYFTSTPSAEDLVSSSITGLKSRIMVAAGGGGGFNGSGGGNAGGLAGQAGQSNNGYGPGPGATQLSGGINTVDAGSNGSFGLGGTNGGSSTGGGGGYYGGAGSNHIDAAGGGSSYISGHPGSIAIKDEEDIVPKCDEGSTRIKCSSHYSGKVFNKTVMKSGLEEMPTWDGTSTMTGNADDGFVKITPLIEKSIIDDLESEITEPYNVKEKPAFIDYLDDIDFDGTVNISQLTPSSNPTYTEQVDAVRSGKIVSTISNVILNEEYAKLKLDSGKIDVNVNSKTAIENRGDLVINDAEINLNNYSDIGIFNETNSTLVFNGGSINAIADSTIALINRSNTPTISGVKIVTSQANSIGIRNEALSDITFSNLDITGAGMAFREASTGNTIINSSNFSSTGNYTLYNFRQSLPAILEINSSNFNGSIALNESTKKVNINSSTLTSIYNYRGNISIYNSDMQYFENRGQAVINKSTITGANTIVYNVHAGLGRGSSSSASNLLLKNSTLNSTATSPINVITNGDVLDIQNVTINNINGAKSTVFNNTYVNYDINNNVDSGHSAYLNIPNSVTIDPSFGTAINNTGIVTLGSEKGNVETEFDYAYTGHQEEFVAPVDGTYKLETWGASGSGAYDDRNYNGGPGGYASGTIALHAGDKLYIHVGGVGSSSVYSIDGIGYFDNNNMGFYGAYNGGYPQRKTSYWGYLRTEGAGGGATDISLSNEDNTWSFENGIALNTRSTASYNQRILVAGGGSGCGSSSTCYGGYDIDPSTSSLGVGSFTGGGGGYYGGATGMGGSSYASNTLSNVVLISGNQEMPDYNNGYMLGNNGSGYAKITLLNNVDDKVITTPNIIATDYGVTGTGEFRFLDGTINAKVAVNTNIDVVPEGYDIYNSIDSSNNEKMILVANANSRPVASGEEEFVAAIGNAKYTTIQKAVDIANNGDEIDLLVNIEEQNMITIPENKIITIDYNGHTVKSYNPDTLYKNYGNLTITDSTNTLGKNIYMGNNYIYNEGTLSISKIYLVTNTYNVCHIDNNEGIVNLDSVRFDMTTGIEDKVGVRNSENGVINAQNSTFNVWSRNVMFSNNGTLTLKNNTLLNGHFGKNIVYNGEGATATLDGNSLILEGNGGNGHYLIVNDGTATIKNMTYAINASNQGTLTLEGTNNIPSGTLNSTGLVIINSGTYKNIFNINDGGQTIDDTEDLYSFIMNDGTINATLNVNTTNITSIKGGTISVTSGAAINNTAAGIINLGIKDGTVLNKDNTKPVITGKTYGIYTSVPALKVNFYDGIVSGNKAYNVTVKDVETGYSIHRDYDDTNNIETKYLTSEPIFKNATHTAEYNSISELNTALNNGSIVDNDVIQVYRDITLVNNDSAIIIPNGLSIKFDINNKTVDKNNTTMFINNGELEIIDSVNNSTGKIDSTIGNILENNGTLKITSGSLVSEKANEESRIIKNNEGATLNITGGTLTKYYDWLGQVSIPEGIIVDNSGTATVTGGKFYSNASCSINGVYIFSSMVFNNRETGTLTVTGGEYNGITSNSIEYDGSVSNGTGGTSAETKGILIYNSGIASIKNIESNQSIIGNNSGTLTLDNITMNNIIQMSVDRWSGGRGGFANLINTGNVNITNSNFKTKQTFIQNIGGYATIEGTIIDRLEDGPNNGIEDYYYDSYGGRDFYRTSQLVYNFNTTGEVNIIDSELYNKGTGYILYNKGIMNVEDSILDASNNSSAFEVGGTLNVKGNTSIISQNGNVSAVSLSSGATFNLGEPIEIDGAVSQTKPLVKGVTYGLNNSGSTFNFYDGLIEGKTLAVNGSFTTLEVGYTVIYDTDGDYKSNYLDRIPIIQNVTQATEQDEKKYYDLKTAFEDANDNDTLKMLADYSTLPADETAVNDHIITFDMNGKMLRQSNDLLIQNDGTLNIKDDSQNTDGNVILLSGTNMIVNNGTINFTSGKLSTTTSNVTLIKNNSGSSLTVKDYAKIDSSSSATLIDSSGTTNIYNGAYLHTVQGYGIINRNILNVVDFNNDDDENTSSNLEAPWLNVRNIYNDYHGNPTTIYNVVGATATIYGGIFTDQKTYETGSPDYAVILGNEGTVTIRNLNSYAYHIGGNAVTGTLTIENSTLHNIDWHSLNSRGIFNVRYTEIETNYPSGDKLFVMLGNSSISNFDHVRFTGADSNASYGGIILAEGTIINIDYCTFDYKNVGNLINNTNGTTNITNSTINTTTGISSAKLNIDHSDITTSGYALSSSGTINIKNNSNILSTNANAVSISGSGTLNVIGENTIISNNGAAITLSDSATLNLGEIGGIPDTDTPYIEGTTFGIYNNSTSTTFNFYDGRVIGQTGPNAIYGSITNVESNYEPTNVSITDPDTNISKYNEYLVFSTNSVAVAKVGNYSFASVGAISPSRALQNAINFAIGDGTNVKSVDLTSIDIDLVNDEYSVTASMPVTINLNGHHVIQNSTYTLSSNITLNNNTGVGANVSKLLGDVFDISNTSKDIVIYELSDGSKLDTTKIYKLYKDDKVIGLEKEELGRYKYKGNDEELTPIKGRLYIDNLYKGSYRLVSSDNKSIEFNIDSDGNINGNVTENTRNSNESSAQANSEAELILTIQTGNKKNHYIFIIISVVLMISLLIIGNKIRKRES